MPKFLILLFVGLFSFADIAGADTVHPERWYNELWCGLEKVNQTEVSYKDSFGVRSRADCVTRDYAIETEFAPKYKYASGQAMTYSNLSGKKAGILLIIEKPGHWKYYKALMRDLRKKKMYIRVWTIGLKK